MGDGKDTQGRGRTAIREVIADDRRKGFSKEVTIIAAS